MPSLALARNQRVWIDDAMHEVRDRAVGEVVHLERVRDGEMRIVTHRELAELICADKAKLVAVEGTGREPRIVEHNLEKDIAALQPKVRMELDRRREYLKAVEEGGVLTLTERSLSGLVRQVAEKIGDAKPPHWTTIYRWISRLRRASGDIRAVIPAFDRRGNRTRRLDTEVIRLIDEGIDQRFMQREQPPARAAHDYVVRMIDDLNQVNPPERKLRLPSLRSIYRAIARLDDYEVTLRRFGKRIADLKYHVVREAPKPTRPLERVEMDHTKLDLMVLDDAIGTLRGRPWLTLAVDVYTRMPVGFHLGFSDPCANSVVSCLLHAIRPKTYVAERYPDIKHTWDCYGVPETVVVDNGREFHSIDWEYACLQLGIQIQHTPRKSPWMKGTVERYFGQLNQGLIHSQPGTTFSNIAARGDYDPKKNGIITFSLLVELIHQWIIDVYARSEHRGIADLPGERWKAGVKEYPVRLPAKAADLDVVLWQTDTKTVNDYGIAVDQLIYNSEELCALCRVHGGRLRTTVKIDPEEMGDILVLDPAKGAFFRVPAVSQGYARGLTRWQHKVILAEAKRNTKAKIDIVHLARTRETLLEKAHEARNAKKRTKFSSRVARFVGIDSRPHTKPVEEPPPPAPEPTAPPAPEPPTAPRPPSHDDDDWGGSYDLPPRR